MLAKTTIPDLIDHISIGENQEYVKKYTNLCELVTSFDTLFDLSYKWQVVLTGSDPLNELRNFVKDFIVVAPELDTYTVIKYIYRIRNFNPYFSSIVLKEVDDAFIAAQEIKKPKAREYENGVAVNLDGGFLNKLAELIQTCQSPCNYFTPISDSLGMLGDSTNNVSTTTSPMWDTDFKYLPIPLHMPVNLFNKVSKSIINEVLQLGAAVELSFRKGLSPFFTSERVEKESVLLKAGRTLDTTSDSEPFTTDLGSYFIGGAVSSNIFGNIRKTTQDCFRLFDFYKRFNYQDSEMNLAKASRRKYVVSQGGYPVVVDMYGKALPNYVIPQEYRILSTGVNPVTFEGDDEGEINYNYPTKVGFSITEQIQRTEQRTDRDTNVELDELPELPDDILNQNPKPNPRLIDPNSGVLFGGDAAPEDAVDLQEAESRAAANEAVGGIDIFKP